MTRVANFPVVCSALLLAASALTGCSSSFEPTPVAVVASPAVTISGEVHGGQSPVSGAAVYLFGASTAGYGTANTSLLKTTASGVKTDGAGQGYVTTDGTGKFSLATDFDCTGSPMVYLVAVGGDPGLGGGTNPVSKQMAALGACSGFGAGVHVVMNEVTTVGAVTALAPFMTASTGGVATSATNVAGLTNAFTTAANLVNTTTGAPNATTASGLGAIPVVEINTLADVLAACVNTNGSLTTGGTSPMATNCGTLFTATTPTGGSKPTDTLQAMINIAQHPGQNVATLFGLVPGTGAPFSPTVAPVCNPLSGGCQNAPTDWTVAISYTTGSLANKPLNGVNYLALDSKSNVWAVSSGNAIQLSNSGYVNYNIADQRFFTNNYNQVLAVDLNDSVWFDENSYAVGKITSAGNLVCAVAPGGGYCDKPGLGTAADDGYTTPLYLYGYGGVAIHPATNHVWAGSSSNAASAMVELDNNGVGLASYTEGNIINPTSVAVDTSGNLWFPSQKGPPSPGGTIITRISQTGTLLSGTGIAGGGLNAPIAIAFDKGGYAWVANQTGTTGMSVFNASGAVVTGSPFTNGGVNQPSSVAVDGDNHVWVANFYSTQGVAEFDAATRTAISPATSFYGGYYTGSENTEVGAVAIDASGNVWLASWGTNSINELVGAGAPTVNPVVLATKNGTIGVRP